MTQRSLGNLSKDEVALIKAMWLLDKEHGFHVQKIQSYFSRPNRTVNPARFYEIRDEKLGADVTPASETLLAEFLFETQRKLGIFDEPAASITRMPPYMYIGIREGRITVLSREEIFTEDDIGSRTRDKLLAAQVVIAHDLARSLLKSNADPRMADDFRDYANLAEGLEGSPNIFLVHRRFLEIQGVVRGDPGAIGERNYRTWQIFEQNHGALCALYPEMQDNLAALPATEKAVAFPIEAAVDAYEIMSDKNAENIIDKRVPDIVEESIRVLQDNSPHPKNEQKLNIISTISRSTALLCGLTAILPVLEARLQAAEKLRERLAPVAKFLADWYNGP